MIKSGKIVGPASEETAAGLVPKDPRVILTETNAALAQEGKLPISLDELALARALRSEHGISSAEVRTWVGWAIRNAAGSPSKIFTKLTTSGNVMTSGHFASQITDTRYAATNQGPTMADIDLARAIVRAPAGADPTKGATNFFSPKLQDQLKAKADAGNPKFAKIKKDAQAVRVAWAATGLVSRGAPASAAPGEVEFFGRRIA